MTHALRNTSGANTSRRESQRRRSNRESSVDAQVANNGRTCAAICSVSCSKQKTADYSRRGSQRRRSTRSSGVDAQAAHTGRTCAALYVLHAAKRKQLTPREEGVSVDAAHEAAAATRRRPTLAGPAQQYAVLCAAKQKTADSSRTGSQLRRRKRSSGVDAQAAHTGRTCAALCSALFSKQ